MEMKTADVASLTALGNAIRSKSAAAEPLESAEGTATVIGSVECGGSVFSGVIVPEKTLSLTVDVGAQFTRFLVYSPGSVVGYGVKGCRMVYFDASSGAALCISTNDAGTSQSVLNPTESIKITDTSFTVESSREKGSVPGYFIPVEYRWFAW